MSCGLLWCEMQSKVSKPVKLPLTLCVCASAFVCTKVVCVLTYLATQYLHYRSLLFEQQMELITVVWIQFSTPSRCHCVPYVNLSTMHSSLTFTYVIMILKHYFHLKWSYLVSKSSVSSVLETYLIIVHVYMCSFQKGTSNLIIIVTKYFLLLQSICLYHSSRQSSVSTSIYHLHITFLWFIMLKPLRK